MYKLLLILLYLNVVYRYISTKSNYINKRVFLKFANSKLGIQSSVQNEYQFFVFLMLPGQIMINVYESLEKIYVLMVKLFFCFLVVKVKIFKSK